MSEKIKPALTAEEWAGVMQAERYVRDTPWSDGGGFNVTIASEAWGNDWRLTHTTPLRGPHAIAAYALYNQPFGFTREDVTALVVAQAEARKAVMIDCGSDGAVCVDCEAACERFCARLQSLADRIEALLPPDK